MIKKFVYILTIYFFDFYGIIESIHLSSDQKFPIHEEELFTLKLNTNTESLPLYTVILLQCIKNGSLLETAILNPGYLKGLPKRIYGECFSIQRYDIKSQSIDIVFKFQRLSNEANLDVGYLETGSEAVRSEFMRNKNYQTQNIVLTLRVTLNLKWKLDLIQKTFDHRKGGLLVGSVGRLICRATDGSPFSKATLGGLESLDKVKVERELRDNDHNEAQFSFLPTINDHMKKVSCSAGPEKIDSNIVIYHHPTTVNIDPPSQEYVQNNTSIFCKALNGYPVPKSQWIFKHGPPHAELFYSINNSRDVLHINGNAPRGTKWRFQCRATNTIPNSIDGGTLETLEFIVGERPRRTILIIAASLSGVCLLFLMVICVICCRSGKCCHKEKKSPKNVSPPISKDSTFKLIYTELSDKKNYPIDLV